MSARGQVPLPPPAPRIKTRWYFVAALLLGALAVAGLPTPFSGIAAMACVGVFIAGGANHIKSSDPEAVDRPTRSGIIGGGG